MDRRSCSPTTRRSGRPADRDESPCMDMAKPSLSAKRIKGGRRSRLARGPPRRHLPLWISDCRNLYDRCRRGKGTRQSPQKRDFRHSGFAFYKFSGFENYATRSRYPVDSRVRLLIYYAPVAPVVKLAHTLDSGSSAERLVGSSPTGCTKKLAPSSIG